MKFCFVVRRRVAAGLGLLVVSLALNVGAACAAPQESGGGATKPDPKLSPADVIGIQLEALRDNDTPEKDSGIARAFEFASPGNRAATGPLDNFIQLVKSPAYRPMLKHRRADRGPLRVSGDEARQRVTLTDAQGRRHTYVFVLSRQTEGPYKDCWMTDGVILVPPDAAPDENTIALALACPTLPDGQ